MANKRTDTPIIELQRIRDLSKLVPGTTYHLRKPIEKFEKVWNDEVHDIVFAELEGTSLVEKDTDFLFPSEEYDIFLAKIL